MTSAELDQAYNKVLTELKTKVPDPSHIHIFFNEEDASFEIWLRGQEEKTLTTSKEHGKNFLNLLKIFASKISNA